MTRKANQRWVSRDKRGALLYGYVCVWHDGSPKPKLLGKRIFWDAGPDVQRQGGQATQEGEAMKCDECGQDFEVDADEPFRDERTICYRCERELVAEAMPELIGACRHCGSTQCYGTRDGVMTCCVTGKPI